MKTLKHRKNTDPRWNRKVIFLVIELKYIFCIIGEAPSPLIDESKVSKTSWMEILEIL